MKMMKRIGSILLVLTMLAGSVGILPSKAAGSSETFVINTFGGTPTMTADWWEISGNTTSTTIPGDGRYYFKDVQVFVESGETSKQCKADIIREGAKNFTLWSTDLKGTPEAGTKVTIKKGTYSCSEGYSITLEKDYAYEWNGSKFVTSVVGENFEISTFGGSPSFQSNYWEISGNTTSTTIPGDGRYYFKDVQVVVESGETSKQYKADIIREAEKKFTLWSTDLTGTPAAGTKVTIKKGTYSCSEGYSITLAKDYTYEWNGSKFEIHVDAAKFEISEFGGNPNIQPGYWEIGGKTSTTIPGTAWSTNFVTDIVLEVNGVTEPLTMSIAKAAGDKSFNLFTANKGGEPADGTKLTIKKGVYASEDGAYAISIAKDYVYEWDGTKFVAGTTVENYQDVTFEGLALRSYSDSRRQWDFYLKFSADLQGTKDATAYNGLKMSINGGEKFSIGVTYSSYTARCGFIPIPSDKLPKDPTENLKIVIHAGKAKATDNTKGIRLTKDFTIYFNKWGWSTEGYAAEPKFQNFTLENINGATAYSDGNGAWLFYLDPSVALPGKGDITNFAGLTMSIDGGTPFNVTLTHSSHHSDKKPDTLFFVIGKDKLPKEITKDTKIVIHAGQAVANDGSDGIKLDRDFTIYANQYGFSTTGYVPAYNYQGFTFKSVNVNTVYSKKNNGWLVYLDPSVELPGKADSTSFSGLNMTINDNKTIGAGITKSSTQNTAFLFIAKEHLPENITQNTKIVIKAGKAQSNDHLGIKLEQDFVIYANQYGWSTTGFMNPITPSEVNVSVAVDRKTAFGGDENGIYLTTKDNFPVDNTWMSRIKGVTYDDNSGVFVNGDKINAPLIKFENGKLYLGLRDAGYVARNHDVITIKGLFTLNGYGVTYATYTLHFNGKIWGETYTAPAPETYTKIKATTVNAATTWGEKSKRWDVYLNVDAMLPGEKDQISFNKLTVKIGNKTFDTTVHHSHEHTLFFVIPEEYLPGNSKDGVKITLLKGKALASDKSTGIELTEDFTFYTYEGVMTELEPTTNTDWQEANIYGLLRAGNYSDAAQCWNVYVRFTNDLRTEKRTLFLRLPVEINGKTHYFKATQEGSNYLYFSIPGSILPKDTKAATISIKEGATTKANAGRNGIKIVNSWEAYVFNYAISDTQFTEIEKTEAKITGLKNITSRLGSGAHVYLRLNVKMPGTTWYEYYSNFVYEYNGVEYTTEAAKAEGDKFLYFRIDYLKTGDPKDGDIITLKEGAVLVCGGYEITLTNGYQFVYRDGLWSQYIESSVAKPENLGSLWSFARFDKRYIPTTKDGNVLTSGEDEYSLISSTKKLKDYTISFRSTKNYDDETASVFKLILRGNPISADEPMSTTLLYGYVISFEAVQVADPKNPEEKIWGGYLSLWKNGENSALIDQYRVHYETVEIDHAFWEYGKEYQYEVSVYNVTDTCTCIEMSINGTPVMRYYDEASSDPLDPVVNEGTFAIWATGPSYVGADTVDLAEVIAEKDKCETGEKVRVAATYPALIEGVEYTVDSKNATVKDGVFVAEKAGTYTISCTYKGKELKAKTITVVKAETEASAMNGTLWIVIAGTSVGLIAVAVVLVIFWRKKHLIGRKDA